MESTSVAGLWRSLRLSSVLWSFQFAFSNTNNFRAHSASRSSGLMASSNVTGRCPLCVVPSWGWTAKLLARSEVCVSLRVQSSFSQWWITYEGELHEENILNWYDKFDVTSSSCVLLVEIIEYCPREGDSWRVEKNKSAWRILESEAQRVIEQWLHTAIYETFDVVSHSSSSEYLFSFSGACRISGILLQMNDCKLML